MVLDVILFDSVDSFEGVLDIFGLLLILDALFLQNIELILQYILLSLAFFILLYYLVLTQ